MNNKLLYYHYNNSNSRLTKCQRHWFVCIFFLKIIHISIHNLNLYIAFEKTSCFCVFPSYRTAAAAVVTTLWQLVCQLARLERVCRAYVVDSRARRSSNIDIIVVVFNCKTNFVCRQYCFTSSFIGWSCNVVDNNCKYIDRTKRCRNGQ